MFKFVTRRVRGVTAAVHRLGSCTVSTPFRHPKKLGRVLNTCRTNTTASAPTGNKAWADRENVFMSAPVYPHFKPSISGPEFLAQFANLNSGERNPEHIVRIAGRITSKREASKKLIFYDLESSGQRLQMMSPLKQYKGGEGEDSTEPQFHEIHELLRRGDIVGIEGFPGKTKVRCAVHSTFLTEQCDTKE